MEKKITFQNFRGMELKGIINYDENKRRPCVIISHGFLSFKENKLLFKIAKKLHQEGFAALRYDFSGCTGESEGSCEDIMLSHLIDDLISAVNFVSDLDCVDSNRIGLVGHSLGGLTSLIVASRVKLIKSLATVAAPANIQSQKLINEKMAEIWEHDKQLAFDMGVKKDVKIDFQFYKDMKEYDGLKIARNIEIPTRLIQGDNDPIIPVENAKKLLEVIPGKKDLSLIKGGDHMFLDRGLSNKVSSLVAEWMKENL